MRNVPQKANRQTTMCLEALVPVIVSYRDQSNVCACVCVCGLGVLKKNGGGSNEDEDCV